MEQSPGFEAFLKKRWTEVYKSSDSKFFFRGDVEKVEVGEDKGVYVIYNQSLKKKKPTQISEKNNSVFQSFEPAKFNFNKVTAKQVLFYFNMDDEEIITKEKAILNASEFLDNDLEQADQQSENHPIIANTSPIYKNHSLLVMFPESQLPQVVGSEVLLLVLILCKVSPNLSIGFNSLGAACSVNHLHFQLLYSKDVIGVDSLPLQSAPRKLHFKSTLVNPKSQINMYSQGVIIEGLQGPAKGFVISPIKEDADQAQVFSSLSFVFGLIINQILDRNIPHNILICQGGRRIFILPRKFCTQTNQAAWLEFSGVDVVKDHNQFLNFKKQQWVNKIEELQIDDQTLNQILKNVKTHLSQYT